MLKETRIELPPTWRFYSARLVRLERFVLKETRIELPPTWRFYPARLVRLERFVLKETTHTAVPHVASNVRYISFQRNLQLKIYLSSLLEMVTTQVVVARNGNYLGCSR